MESLRKWEKRIWTWDYKSFPQRHETKMGMSTVNQHFWGFDTHKKILKWSPDTEIKEIKHGGNNTATHKSAIENKDLQKFKSSQVLLPSNPQGLLRNVWFHTTLYWCRKVMRARGI